MVQKWSFDDGEETSELISSYVLSKLSSEYGNKILIYRGVCLFAFDKTPREIIGVTKRPICKVVSHHKLKITIEANKKCVDILDSIYAMGHTNHSQNLETYVHHRKQPPVTYFNVVQSTMYQRGFTNVESI